MHLVLKCGTAGSQRVLRPDFEVEKQNLEVITDRAVLPARMRLYVELLTGYSTTLRVLWKIYTVQIIDATI